MEKRGNSRAEKISSHILPREKRKGERQKVHSGVNSFIFLWREGKNGRRERGESIHGCREAQKAKGGRQQGRVEKKRKRRNILFFFFLLLLLSLRTNQRSNAPLPLAPVSYFSFLAHTHTKLLSDDDAMPPYPKKCLCCSKYYEFPRILFLII